MVKALFDTNIQIDYLNGEPQANTELGRFDGRCISIVTWMEVMVGADPAMQAGTEAFLTTFTIVPVDPDVARSAVDLRRQHRMKRATPAIFRPATPGCACPIHGRKAAVAVARRPVIPPADVTHAWPASEPRIIPGRALFLERRH